MRLWVRHDQRRPQPEPAATNDSLAFAVGLGLWGLALVVVLAAPLLGGVLGDSALASVDGMLSGTPLADQPRALTTVLLGLALGVVGLLVSRRHARARR